MDLTGDRFFDFAAAPTDDELLAALRASARRDAALPSGAG
jgi:hypothetical protein